MIAHLTLLISNFVFIENKWFLFQKWNKYTRTYISLKTTIWNFLRLLRNIILFRSTSKELRYFQEFFFSRVTFLLDIIDYWTNFETYNGATVGIFQNRLLFKSSSLVDWEISYWYLAVCSFYIKVFYSGVIYW